jgi:uncharacterized phage infection (PIP) family protein YhgE
MKNFTIILATAAIILTGSLGQGSVVVAQSMEQDGATAQQLNLENARDLLSLMLTQLNNHFEKTAANSSESSGTPQIMQGYISQVNALETEVVNDQTTAQLKATAQKIHALIQDARQNVKKNLSKRISDRISQVAQKTQKGQDAIQKAQEKLNQIKNDGPDIEQMKVQLSNCQNLIQEGSQNLQQAKDEFQQVETLSGDQQDQQNQLVQDGMEKVKNASGAYARARQNCPGIMKKLRALQP